MHSITSSNYSLKNLPLLLDLSLTEFVKCKCPITSLDSWHYKKKFANVFEILVGLLIVQHQHEKRASTFVETYLDIPKKKIKRSRKFNPYRTCYSIISENQETSIGSDLTLNLKHRFKRQAFLTAALNKKNPTEEFSFLKYSGNAANFSLTLKLLGGHALRYVVTRHLLSFEFLSAHAVDELRRNVLSHAAKSRAAVSLNLHVYAKNNLHLDFIAPEAPTQNVSMIML